MNYDSIYPEFFRTGIGKLQNQAGSGEALGLFSALEQFRRDLNSQTEVQAVLGVAERYIGGLDLFKVTGFFLVNPKTFAFEMARCSPSDQGERLERLVAGEIKAGRFAWALRQETPFFFTQPGPDGVVKGTFQALGVSTHRLGMFCGVLSKDRAPRLEITFSLLSILLGATADALVGIRRMEALQTEILVANQNLQRTLNENEVLARIPAESPSPVLRLDAQGRVLYSNSTGREVLSALGFQVGDLISGDWLEMLRAAFTQGRRSDFEATFQGRNYAFLIVPVPDAGYANFYGTDITARKKAEAERELLISELQDALAKVKKHSGLVQICARCKKIRDDKGFWEQIEVFIQSHSEAVFTHGVCPECMKKIVKDNGLEE